jgi:2-keto-3-deoxy-L-rhamnonate aldolase RhmA
MGRGAFVLTTRTSSGYTENSIRGSSLRRSISLRLGFPTDPPNKVFMEAIDAILAACRRHHVVAGTHFVPGVTTAELIAKGFQFVTAGVDRDFLVSGALHCVQEAKSR